MIVPHLVSRSRACGFAFIIGLILVGFGLAGAHLLAGSNPGVLLMVLDVLGFLTVAALGLRYFGARQVRAVCQERFAVLRMVRQEGHPEHRMSLGRVRDELKDAARLLRRWAFLTIVFSVGQAAVVLLREDTQTPWLAYVPMTVAVIGLLWASRRHHTLQIRYAIVSERGRYLQERSGDANPRQGLLPGSDSE